MGEIPQSETTILRTASSIEIKRSTYDQIVATIATARSSKAGFLESQVAAQCNVTPALVRAVDFEEKARQGRRDKEQKNSSEKSHSSP